MQTRTDQTDAARGFDAVSESRRWKETVAAMTVGMTASERMAWFRRQSSVASIRANAEAADPSLLVREEPAPGTT